jgi:Rrf2 family protein
LNGTKRVLDGYDPHTAKRLRLTSGLGPGAKPAHALAKQIAQEQNLPVAFVKKLLQKLCRAGLVKATVGKQGGYALARAPQEISIRELLEALEGDLAPVSCLASDHLCELADGCTTRRIWEQIDQKIQEALESLSLGDILGPDAEASGLASESPLKRASERA